MTVPIQRSDPMAEHGPMIPRDGDRGRGTGLVIFAAVMMIVLGAFHALLGLTAVLRDQFFVAAPNYLYSVDVTTWGWSHLIGGAIVAVAGFFVFSGALWARVVGIALAVVSAIANFLFIPHYPFWALLMIVVDILVIWALAIHRPQVAS